MAPTPSSENSKDFMDTSPVCLRGCLDGACLQLCSCFIVASTRFLFVMRLVTKHFFFLTQHKEMFFFLPATSRVLWMLQFRLRTFPGFWSTVRLNCQFSACLVCVDSSSLVLCFASSFVKTVEKNDIWSFCFVSTVFKTFRCFD